jgi:hypothetical protein
MNIGAAATSATQGDANRNLAAYTINNSGLVSWEGDGNIQNTGGSTFNNLAGGVFEARNNQTYGAQIGGSPRMNFNNSGTVRKASGTETTRFGNVQFTHTGVLEVVTGIVRFDAPFSPSAASVIRLALGGLTPGTQFSRVEVAGALTLAGVLEFRVVNPFVPAAGNTFDVLSYNSVQGTFANAVNLTPVPGLTLAPQYGAQTLTLLAQPGAPLAFNTGVVQVDNGRIRLAVDAGPGERWVIEASEDLHVWEEVRAIPLLRNGRTELVEADVAGLRQCFFRARILTE